MDLWCQNPLCIRRLIKALNEMLVLLEAAFFLLFFLAPVFSFLPLHLSLFEELVLIMEHRW